MNNKLWPVILFVLAVGCGHTQPKITTFETPYGEIQKGSSMVEVMHVLGNPTKIFTTGDGETWYYYYSDNKRVFVYFTGREVTDVKSSEDPNP